MYEAVKVALDPTPAQERRFLSRRCSQVRI